MPQGGGQGTQTVALTLMPSTHSLTSLSLEAPSIGGPAHLTGGWRGSHELMDIIVGVQKYIKASGHWLGLCLYPGGHSVFTAEGGSRSLPTASVTGTHKQFVCFIKLR